MSAEIPNVRQVQGYCSLCIARCGTVATVTDGRFTRLDPDPTHPTGAAICAKGRAAPELVYHKDRLKRPLRRTRPKGDSDPGWEEISWDAALDQTATATPVAGQTGNNFLIEQAFGEISLPGNLTVDFGKFVTTAGAEVIEANKNWLYSRSILFNVIPLVHTGVRAGLKVSDQLSLQASVVNGWNNDPDANAWKTPLHARLATAELMLASAIRGRSACRRCRSGGGT